MRILDVHTHCFPEKIAYRAVSHLGGSAGFHPYHDGTPRGLERSRRRAGISACVVLPVATRPENTPSINRWILERRDPNLIFFGGLHPRYERYEEEIETLARAGVRGVKFHPNFQDFLPDDPTLAPVFRALARHRMIAFFHAGYDFSIPGAPGSPERFARLHDRHPELTLVCAHFGGWRLWDDVEKFLLGRPNLYLDTSFVLGYLPDARLVDMSRRHGTDRILFGTDTPWREQADDVQLFLDLRFSPEEREAILWKNAARLLHLTPADFARYFDPVPS